MAFFNVVAEYDTPPEYLYSCPYNMEHSVTLPEFLRHVLTCAYHHVRECLAQGQQPQFHICNFDMRHHVPIMYLDEHHEMCSARRRLYGGNVPVTQQQQPSGLLNERNLDELRDTSGEGSRGLMRNEPALETLAQTAPIYPRDRRNGSLSSSSSSLCSSLSLSPAPSDADE